MRRTRSIRLVLAIVATAFAFLVAAPAAHAQYEGGATLTVSDTSPECGQSVTITGSGFEANAKVTLSIAGSTIGTATADAAGKFTFVYAVPANCTAGTTVISATAGATVLSVTLTVGTGATGGTTSELPRTGSDNGNLVRIGVVLLAVGGLLVLATRKRSATATHS